MSEVVWGVPTQRTAKVEKFTTPVVTMSALDKIGAGRKMSFNKAAQELLGLVGGESYIAIGFGKDNNIFMQSFAEEVDHGLALTKTCTLSNKKLYEYIAKINILDVDVENYLHLSNVEGEGLVTVSRTTNDAIADTIDDTIDEVINDITDEVEINESMIEAEEEAVANEGTGKEVFSAAGEGVDDDTEEEAWN